MLDTGTFTAVMGPSGSGKSTLLNCAAGLERPTEGTVAVGGETLTALDESKMTKLRRERVGFVFQGFHLVPYLTAEQNVALPLRLMGRRVRRSDIHAALDLVGLAEQVDRLPSQLSGGQQQRVAMARAMVTEPALLCADEPTGQLDTRSAREVLGLLRGSVDRAGQTVLMVTHDAVAASYADQVVFLVDGRIVGRMTHPTVEAVATQLANLDELVLDGRCAMRGPGGPGVRADGRRSGRDRRSFVAGFVSMFLGAVVVGSFASLLATGLDAGHLRRRPGGAGDDGVGGRRLGSDHRAVLGGLDHVGVDAPAHRPRSACSVPSALSRDRCGAS